MEAPTRPEVCFSKPIHAKQQGNGPPSASQGLSITSEVAMLFAPLGAPTHFTRPTLSAEAEPVSKGQCRCHSRLRPAVDSVRPGPDMLADCVRFRG